MQVFSRAFVSRKIKFAAVFSVVAIIILSLVAYNADAIVTTTITDLTPTFGGQKLKQGSDATAVLKVQFGSDSDTETLTSIKVTFTGSVGTPTWTSGAATSSELLDLAITGGGIELWKDAGAAGFQGSGTDTEVALTASPTYASATTFVLNPASDPTLATDDIYFIVFKSDSSGVTNANAFTVGIAADGDIVTSASNPTITPVTSRAIAIDTVAPTLNSATSFPQSGSIGQAISMFPHMTFSEQLDQTTLTSTNITLTAGSAVGGAIRAFPDGFDFVISSPPTYTASTSFAKFATVSTAFFQIFGTSAISPQGAYSAPAVGDIVMSQRETFPPELGLVTNATLTSGTFAVNGFAAFNPQQITKMATPAATGAVTAATAVTAGDIIVVNTSANPTSQKYDWHIVTTGANANAAGLRLDGAGAAPTYVSGSRFSTITPAGTATDNGATAGQVLAVSVGDLVFVKIGSTYGWHQVTTAGNLSSDATENTAFLDNGAADPGITASSQMSKIASAANGLVSESATVFSFGDIVFAQTTANAANNGAYNFHIVSNGATGASSSSLRFDNAAGTLSSSTAYTLTMGTGIKDAAGNALASAQTITFTTGSTGGTNTTPPFVQSSQPQPGSQTHPINAPLKLTFSVDMASSGGGDITSANNIGLFTDNFGAPGTAVTTTKAYDSVSKTVTLTPSANLTASTGYVVKINTTATSTTGAAFPQNYFLSFKTSSGAADSTAPTVLGVNPANAATGAALGTVVTVGFSEDMNPATITTSTITLSGGITGTVTYNPQSRSASFAPSQALAANTEYTFTVVSGGSGVKDLSGNALASNYTSTFTTTASADTAKPLLSFANADNFSVAVTFSEQVKSGGGPNAADNIVNYTLESPVGASISLGGKTVTYEAGTKTARITGLSLTNGNTFKVTVAPVVQDLSSNVMETTGTPAGNVQFATVQSSSGGGMIGPGTGTIDPGAHGMNPTNVTPMSRGAGATSRYMVNFLATTSVPSGGQVVLTFPDGFTLTNAAAVSAANSFCNADLNGPGTGTPTIASVAGSGNTVTITTASAATGANAFLCLELSDIVNSTVPSSTGYTVTIQTKDTAANNRATLQTSTAAPFYLGASGSRTLTVNVFKDANSNSTNDDDEGINGVTVFLYSPATGGQEATTATDTIEGKATFSNLADGDYMVGIKPNASINVAFNSAPQPISITGNTTKNFALSNAAALTISGTVTGSNGTKVDVFAASPNGFTKKTLTLTGGADAYSLPVSANSTYNVGVGPAMPETFSTPGAPPPPPPDFTFMPPPNVQVQVASANVTQATVAGLAFSLSIASKTITGTVVDSAGTGVSSAGIFCRPVASGTTSSASGFGTGGQTNTSGAFTLKTIEGVYLCGVFKPGLPPVPEKQITVGASSNTPSTLAFVLDANTSSLTISGTIKDDSGNAIPYAGVSGRKVTSTADTTALGGDSSNFVGGPTDENGSYTLYVSAGTWVVEAFAPGFGRLGTKTITITSSNSTGQDFSAQNTTYRTITGTATSGGTAAQGVMVRVETSDGTNGNMTVSAADGTYTVKVPDGTYNVSCYFPQAGEVAAVGGAVTLSSGTTTAVRNCTAGTLVTVTVNITNGTSGITGAGVDVRDSNGRGNFTNESTTSGANAVYTVKVSPGTYTVRAGHPAYGKLGETASVDADQTITYTATSGVTFAVTGTVTGDGSNLANAWVSLIGTPTGTTNKVFMGGQTGSDGTFSISVPAGSYRLRVDKPGYKSPSESTVTVTGATAAGTIALTTAGQTITGTVTLDGSGVSNAFVDASDGAGGYAVAQTNASGAYSLAVGNGTWTLRAHAPGYEGGPLPVTVSSNNPSGQTITLTAISGFTIKPERPETLTPTSGGLLTNVDIGSAFKVNFPANALGTGSNAATVTTKVNTAMPNPPSGSILAKNAVSIDAVGSDGSPISSLNDEITIVVPYDQANLPAGAVEANLVLGVWNDATQTYDTLATTVDTTNNTLTATVAHLSDFAPMVPSGDSAPSTPASLVVTNPATGTSLTLGWGEVSGASSYNIYRSTDNATFPLLASSATNSYSNTGLTAGTTYYYKVSAVNSSGSESAATEASAGTATTTTPGISGGGGGGGGGLPITIVPAATTTTTTTTTTQNAAMPAMTTTEAVTTYALGTATLRNGSKGEAVRELQRFLNDKLNLGLTQDGRLGPKTIAVIKKWQKDNGLVADGLVGPMTKAQMNASVQ